MDGMMFGSWMDAQGPGWSGIPGAVTTEAGTVAGGPADTMLPTGSGGSGLLWAIMHPTTRQVLFFLAVVLLVLAWQGHIRSMLD